MDDETISNPLLYIKARLLRFPDGSVGSLAMTVIGIFGQVLRCDDRQK